MDVVAALEQANLAVLVSALAHLTGDDSLLDRWDRDAFFRMRNPTTMDDATAAEIRAFAAACLVDAPDPAIAESRSAAVLHRIAEFCAGEPVAADYVPLIVDESDFDGADPRRPTRDDTAPARVPEGFSVVVVGAGLAGVAMGVRLGQAGIPYTILDKNAGIGGTWWENDYPDLRVDVPNLFYSYSFAPNADWSDHYSRRDELQAYVARCADAFGVTEHIRLGCEVVAAEYDATTARWTVRVQPTDGDAYVIEASAVVSAVGMLNRPSVPALAGLDAFAGEWFHSSHWPADLDLADRRVAVVGTGASAVQLVPGIAGVAGHVSVFQRSRHWMMPNPAYLASVTDAERWCIHHVPYYAGWLRFLMFWNNGDRIYDSFHVDPEWESPDISISPANDKLRILMKKYLQRAVTDPDLAARLLPDYPPLGKRILQDGGWFAALQRDDVDLVSEPIDRIVPEGVVTTDGVTHAADVLVLATGFHARRFLWPIDVVGPAGRLHERWGDVPQAYLGITVPGFPNLFCLYGPNTNPVVGSVIFMLECQVDYVVRALTLLVDGGYAAMECRDEVFDDYNARVDAAMEQMVWRHPRVRSYYNNDDGRVVTNAPWRLLDYWRMTRCPDPADYVLVPVTQEVET